MTNEITFRVNPLITCYILRIQTHLTVIVTLTLKATPWMHINLITCKCPLTININCSLWIRNWNKFIHLQKKIFVWKNKQRHFFLRRESSESCQAVKEVMKKSSIFRIMAHVQWYIRGIFVTISAVGFEWIHYSEVCLGVLLPYLVK